MLLFDQSVVHHKANDEHVIALLGYISHHRIVVVDDVKP
jgi:hypothetical protein